MTRTLSASSGSLFPSPRCQTRASAPQEKKKTEGQNMKEEDTEAVKSDHQLFNVKLQNTTTNLGDSKTSTTTATSRCNATATVLGAFCVAQWTGCCGAQHIAPPPPLQRTTQATTCVTLWPGAPVHTRRLTASALAPACRGHPGRKSIRVPGTRRALERPRFSFCFSPLPAGLRAPRRRAVALVSCTPLCVCVLLSDPPSRLVASAVHPPHPLLTPVLPLPFPPSPRFPRAATTAILHPSSPHWHPLLSSPLPRGTHRPRFSATSSKPPPLVVPP